MLSSLRRPSSAARRMCWRLLLHPGSHCLKLFNNAERLPVVPFFQLLGSQELMGIQALRCQLSKPSLERLEPFQVLR